MTISIATCRIQYGGNGVLDTFAYDFRILAAADLKVIVSNDTTGVETALVLNTNYTVTGVGSVSGGNVVLTSGSLCPAGSTITIKRNMTINQTTDWVDGQAFSAQAFEDAADKVTMAIQQVNERLGRTPYLRESYSVIDFKIPDPEASKYLGWNPAATALENKENPSTISYTVTTIKYLSNYASFAAALSSIGSTITTLVVDTAANIDVDTVIPGTLQLKVEKIGTFVIAAGKTLTIGGPFSAGLYQAFSCGAGSVVVFSSGAADFVRPEWWYSGTGSYHTALQAALDSTQGNSGTTVRLHRKTYTLTAGVVIRYWSTHLCGEVESIINFNPSGNGQTAITARQDGMTGLAEGELPYSTTTPYTVQMSRVKLSQFTVQGYSDTFVKTAIKTVGCTRLKLEDIRVNSFYGTRSVGLHTKGHEIQTFRNIQIDCDLPILLDVGPIVGRTPGLLVGGVAIDLDHFHFHDCLLIANGYPCILNNAYSFATGISFTGHQSWNRGTDGICRTYSGFVDVNSGDPDRVGTNFGVFLKSVRMEQAEVVTGWNVYMANMDGVSIQDTLLAYGRKGVYYRKGGGAPWLSMDNVMYASASLLALDVTADEERVSWKDCFWQQGCTMSLGALSQRFAAFPSYFTIPSTAIYTKNYQGKEMVKLMGAPVHTGSARGFSQGINVLANAAAAAIQIADNVNLDMTAHNCAFAWEGSLPSWTPAANVILRQKLTGGKGFQLEVVATTGLIKLTLNATAYTSSVSPSVTDGMPHQILAVVTVGAVNTTVDFYFDGLLLGAQQTAANPGTLANAAVEYVMGTSSVMTAGVCRFIATFNRELTAAAAFLLFTNGIDFANKWGSQTPIESSDFSAGVSGWSASGGAVAGNIDSIGGEDDWLRFTCNNASAQHAVTKAGLVIGCSYKVSFKCFIPSTNSNIIDVYMSQAGATGKCATLDAATTISSNVFVAASTSMTFYANSGATFTDAGGDDVFYLKTIVFTKVGAVLALEPEGAQPSPGQWLDSSSNKLHALQPTAGTSLVRAKSDFEIRWTNTWTASHEAQFIGGVDQAILPGGNIRITSITLTGATGANVIIGDGSTANKFVASVALAAYLDCTVASRNHDGTNRKMVIDPDGNITGSITTTVIGIIL